MEKKTSIPIVVMGIVIIILSLLLAMPGDVRNDVFSFEDKKLNITAEFAQYKPVIAFKEKYPDYVTGVSEFPYSENKITVQYENMSLNRIEQLSVFSANSRIFFSLECIIEGKSGGYSGFSLEPFAQHYVEEFKCANYNMDSETLQKLQNTKKILEESDIPIDQVGINYDDKSLYIIVFESPEDINNEKINTILLLENIPASVAYHSGEPNSWDSDSEK